MSYKMRPVWLPEQHTVPTQREVWTRRIKRFMRELGETDGITLTWSDDEVRISPDLGAYRAFRVTFDNLKRLSEEMGTKLIDVEFMKEWMGTDQTGGSESVFEIVIRRQG